MHENKVNYTITRFLYMATKAGILRKPARIPKDLRFLVEFAEEIVRLYEGHGIVIRESLGHDRFCLKAIDVFEDGSTLPRWEVHTEMGLSTDQA